MLDYEKREFQITELRADPNSRRIRGHAAVFNSRSKELWGFFEVVMPGAFTKTLKSGADVRALFNHDPSLLLGRSTKDTLQLWEDAVGLGYSVELPNTSYASDLLEIIRRGDVDQSSFGFRVVADTWRMQDGKPLRELREVELFDVSPVTYPAYTQTDVAARSYFAEQILKMKPPVSDPLASMNMIQAIKKRAELKLHW